MRKEKRGKKERRQRWGKERGKGKKDGIHRGKGRKKVERRKGNRKEREKRKDRAGGDRGERWKEGK